MTETYWIIYAGKREYKLSVKQFEYMKNESANNRTMVWFEDFVISIPHVTSMERVREHKDDLPQLPEQTPMEREKARKRLAEIRAQIKRPVTSGMTTTDEESRRAELRRQAQNL